MRFFRDGEHWTGLLKRHTDNLLILLTIIMVFLIYHQWSNYRTISNSLLSPSQQINPVVPVLVKSSALFDKPLFGIYVPIALNQVTSSELSIKIKGILYDFDPALSIVTIEMENGSEQIFKAGDKLPNGAEIKKIQPDSILIFYRNRLERLSLPKERLDFLSPPSETEVMP